MKRMNLSEPFGSAVNSQLYRNLMKDVRYGGG